MDRDAPREGLFGLPGLSRLLCREYKSVADAVAAFGAPSLGLHAVLLQAGNATGDISHAVPVMRTDASVAVLVVDAQNTKRGGPKIVNQYIQDFGVAPERVAYVCDEKQTTAAKAWSGVCPGKDAQVGSLLLCSVSSSTGMLLDKWRTGKQASGALKAVLRGPKITDLTALLGDLPDAPTDGDRKLARYLLDLQLPLDLCYVVIWGRTSGKSGGLYPEHDIGATGIRDLARAALDQKYAVIIAGDAPAKLAGDFGGRPYWYLGKFWEGPTWPFGPDRSRQVRLFYLLRKLLKAQGKALVHVGMRSGGLDAYGFSGQPIVYIVRRGNSDPRMSSVVEAIPQYFAKVEVAHSPKRRTEIGDTWRGTPGMVLGKEGEGLSFKAIVTAIAVNLGVDASTLPAWMRAAEGLTGHALFKHLVAHRGSIDEYLGVLDREMTRRTLTQKQTDALLKACARLVSIGDEVDAQVGMRGFPPAAIQDVMTEVAACLGTGVTLQSPASDATLQ